MSEYVCPVCSRKFPLDVIQYLSHVKSEIIEKIKKDRPDWKEEQGICPECKQHYESWFDKVK